MAIDVNSIPPSIVRQLAMSTIAMANAFYQDPENEKRFQEWKRKRKENTNVRKK